MHTIFALARLFPFWAVPLAFVFIQIAWHFRRKKNIAQFYFWVGAGLLLFGSFIWIVGRGDLHSDEWVKSFLGM